MKKVILLLLALIVGCVIFLFVYNQRQNAQLVQKLNELPEPVIADIEDTRYALSDNAPDDEDETVEEINEGMSKIKNDYMKETGEELPDDVQEAIEDDLVTEVTEKE